MAFPRRLRIELAPELQQPHLRVLPGARRAPSTWMYLGDVARELRIDRAEVDDLIEHGALAAEPVPGYPNLRRVHRTAVSRLRVRVGLGPDR